LKKIWKVPSWVKGGTRFALKKNWEKAPTSTVEKQTLNGETGEPRGKKSARKRKGNWSKDWEIRRGNRAVGSVKKKTRGEQWHPG